MRRNVVVFSSPVYLVTGEESGARSGLADDGDVMLDWFGQSGKVNLHDIVEDDLVAWPEMTVTFLK